jgi:hypothetical protein
VRKALSTLSWIEKDAIRPDASKQQVTFGFRDKKDFKLEEVRQVIESRTDFKVGEVIEEP